MHALDFITNAGGLNDTISGIDGALNNPGGLLVNEFYNRKYGRMAIAGGAIRINEDLPINLGNGYGLIQLTIPPTQPVGILFIVFGTTKIMSGIISSDGWINVRPPEPLSANTFLAFNVSYPC